ncbi:MAG: hypothetical protein GC186_12450 [Rhodobacteraceae bacterium]|nr:hypothetical protein [Paracoccaceae bacterium]
MIGADKTAGQVARRRVFYIPGYDPVPARRYREMYRKEGAAQAEISGYHLTLSPKQGRGAYGWQVQAEIDGASVQAEVEMLIWADIVRGSMAQGIPATYLQLARTAWVYIGSGALFRLMRLRKGPILAALYPIVMLLVQLGLTCLAGLAAGALVAKLAPLAVAVLVGLAVVPLGLRWFRALDGRFLAYYLMHDYAHTAQARGALPADLAARMVVFRQSIAEALRTEVDEVLVVGHSSGAHLAVGVLADLLRAGEGPAAGGPVLAFLSLGHVIPMVSFLPAAWKLRDDLAFLSTRDDLTWVDVTAPGDGAAFSLCDPVAVSGVAPGGRRWPLVISAAFTQTLSPERWRALRWRFFRLHFQYLSAFDRPRDYDYFRITAGPLTLAARYAGRAASKSRIERPLSRYTSRAA